MKRGRKGAKLDSIAQTDTSENSWGPCVLWSQQTAKYIWTPHIMARSTVMWCGNGRETTCHCGWGSGSRTEARPGARPVLQFTFSHALPRIRSPSVNVISLFSSSSSYSVSSFFEYLVFLSRSPSAAPLIFPDSDLRAAASQRMSRTGRASVAVIL